MSRADAAARDLANEYGLTALPIDLEKVASGLGATVVPQPAPAELSGILLRRDGQPVLGLNADAHPHRQRFALAHLIGHLHLHRGREMILDTVARYRHGNLSSMPTDREEAEANRFAGALLAPEAIVRRMAAEADFDTPAQLVDLLAPRFEMTTTAMAYRLITLGVMVDL